MKAHGFHRIFLALLSVSLLFCLTACGSKKEAASDPDGGTSGASGYTGDTADQTADTTDGSATDDTGTGTGDGSPSGSGKNTTKPNGSGASSTTKKTNQTTSSKDDPEMPDDSYKINVDGLKKNTVYQIESGALTASGMMEQDTVRLIVCLQGLINRTFQTNKIMVYLRSDPSDTFWQEYMSGSGKMLSGLGVQKITSFDQFLTTFQKPLQSTGMIAWDTKVPATANVASTICGLDGYIPVKHDTASGSLYNKLKAMQVPERMSLVGKFTGKGTIPDTSVKSSGSTKCDAYLWAMEKYMARCSTRYIAYTPDGAGSVPGHQTAAMSEAKSAKGNSIPNHDYFIARQCFFFDLTSYEGEAPCDDKNQPVGTDAATMRKIFQKRYDLAGGAMGQVLGFPPWWLKYTTFEGGTGQKQGSLADYDLEWRFTRFATQYNLVKEADAAMPCSMTNGSAYYQYPLKSSYENAKAPAKQTFSKNKAYFTFYLGDYDSSAWLKDAVLNIWKDNQHGKLPIMMPFNPNLSERVPMIFDYVYENKTANDFFTAGDCGAGYVIPSALFKDKKLIDYPGVNPTPRSLPSGNQKWVEYNKPFFQRFGLDITGFIINSYNPLDNDIMDMYNQISPAGNFFHDDSRYIIQYKGVPYVKMGGVTHTDNMNKICESMYQQSKGTEFNFSAFRTVKAMPSDIRRIVEAFKTYGKNRDGREYVYVDPYTFLDLVKQSGQGTIIK